MKENNELLASAKLTSKGQITIPKIVRETLNIEEGDSVIFYLDEKRNIKISNRKDCKVTQDSNKEQVIVKRGKK
jgi:AbrB family looped-hinge helix DNA binding protein